ncbi:helix-hairpin-helix domain-containing protein [Chryseobacterium sp. JUb7]|uniref:helix-hairpin-helix domain-containing protein n=1 Tax=Chryseobacterium sp. JUb7 TaxID=2940599 RepID=UPI002167A79C|nr:helix-hairpin-helix domain-containing protein [Chryseobacterium sp. JUb7]MCS3529444.1 DNA uptake protein ComE-like DNA-binding protein [Chryseobacterium sp. JUb7]
MLLIILFVFQKFTGKEKEDFSGVKFISENNIRINLAEFNPNDLDNTQWEQLGFTEKQISTILNYKKIVGGKFISKEQFKKCFAVSSEKYSELEAYILLPETNKEAKSSGFKNFDGKSLIIRNSFNPDHYSQNDWIKLGFSERQAEAILKYKNYLGGSFVSKEKFRECFIINDENYIKLAPYLILQEKTPEHFKNYTKNTNVGKNKIRYHVFDPNTLDIEGWQSLGFSQGQSKVIVNYRDRNLKGSFKNIEDIQKCFVISAEKFEEIKPYIQLNPSTLTKTENEKSEMKQEKTDFSKVDLNTVTFKQLLEFGFDEKAAGSMLGFRKKLGGFVNKDQILTTYNIDKELMQKLLSTAQLNTSNVIKYTLSEAPEEWLKNHPYFKYSADRIIFYRISEKDEKKIWKLLKIKPEYELRMKWYLK